MKVKEVQMFSAVLFAPDVTAARNIEQAARDSGEVCIYKTMHAFPTAYELTRLLNCFEPDVVFVDLSALEEALVLVRSVRVISRETAIVAFGGNCDPDELERASSAGVSEV